MERLTIEEFKKLQEAFDKANVPQEPTFHIPDSCFSHLHGYTGELLVEEDEGYINIIFKTNGCRIFICQT